jgi:hypothetical protein
MDFFVIEADTLAPEIGRSVVTEVNTGMAWHGMAWHGASGLRFSYKIRGN